MRIELAIAERVGHGRAGYGVPAPCGSLARLVVVDSAKT
jgi:hypothetical protein